MGLLVQESSTARLLADRLGWCHMDTGAMYRAVALAALERDVSPEDEKSWQCWQQALIFNLHDSVLLNGENVSVEIRVDV